MYKKITINRWIRPYKKKDGTKVRGHYRKLKTKMYVSKSYKLKAEVERLKGKLSRMYKEREKYD